MKKVFIYILFFLIGILLYLITNTIIEKFNIGFPAIIINKMNPPFPFNTQYIIDDQIKENIILLNIQYFHNALNTKNNSYPEVVDDYWLEYRKDILIFPNLLFNLTEYISESVNIERRLNCADGDDDDDDCYIYPNIYRYSDAVMPNDIHTLYLKVMFHITINCNNQNIYTGKTENSENTFSLLQSTLPRFFLKNYLNNYLVRYGQEENDSKKLLDPLISIKPMEFRIGNLRYNNIRMEPYSRDNYPICRTVLNIEFEDGYSTLFLFDYIKLLYKFYTVPGLIHTHWFIKGSNQDNIKRELYGNAFLKSIANFLWTNLKKFTGLDYPIEYFPALFKNNNISKEEISEKGFGLYHNEYGSDDSGNILYYYYYPGDPINIKGLYYQIIESEDHLGNFDIIPSDNKVPENIERFKREHDFTIHPNIRILLILFMIGTDEIILSKIKGMEGMEGMEDINITDTEISKVNELRKEFNIETINTFSVFYEYINSKPLKTNYSFLNILIRLIQKKDGEIFIFEKYENYKYISDKSIKKIDNDIFYIIGDFDFKVFIGVDNSSIDDTKLFDFSVAFNEAFELLIPRNMHTINLYSKCMQYMKQIGINYEIIKELIPEKLEEFILTSEGINPIYHMGYEGPYIDLINEQRETLSDWLTIDDKQNITIYSETPPFKIESEEFFKMYTYIIADNKLEILPIRNGNPRDDDWITPNGLPYHLDTIDNRGPFFDNTSIVSELVHNFNTFLHGIQEHGINWFNINSFAFDSKIDIQYQKLYILNELLTQKFKKSEKEVEVIIEGDDSINIETGTLTTYTKPIDLKLNTKGIGYYEKGNDVPIRTIPLDKINSIKYGSEKHEGDKHYITIETSEGMLKSSTTKYVLKDKEDENKVEIVYKKLKGLHEMYLVYQQITGAGGAMAGGGSAGGGSAGGAMDTSDELQINYTEINDFINNFMLYFRNRVRDYDDTLNGILIEYFVNILENLFNFKNNNTEWDTEYKGMIETNTLNIIDISDNIIKIPTYIYLSKNDINIIIKYLTDIGEDVSRLELLFNKIYG